MREHVKEQSLDADGMKQTEYSEILYIGTEERPRHSSSRPKEMRKKKDGIKEPTINKETLRPIIHNNLNQIQQGGCYMDHGLDEDNFSKLLTDEETYGMFEKMLSSIWYNIDDMTNPEAGLNGGKQKKKKKKYLMAVQKGAAFIKSEIQAYQETLTRDKKDTVDSDISSLSTDKGSRDSSAKPKKKSKKDKKKKSKKASKKRRKSKVESEQSDLEEPQSETEVAESELLDEEQEDTIDPDEEELSDEEEEDDEETKKWKAEFDEKIHEILKKAPSEVKNDFTKVSFAKWGKDVYPVLQLNPFDIAPGPATEMWFKMQSNVSVK